MNTRTPDQLRALVPADADLRYISPDLRPLAVPVAELLRDPRNARRHPDKNLTTIRDSFLRFGQRQALVVNRRNLVTEAGNGRLQVAQSLGWQYIAVSFEDDDALTATAFGLVDNQSALTAEWDDEIRAELLHGLQDEGEDLSKLGFDDDDLAKLLAIKSDNDKFDDDSIDKTGDVNTNRADELQKEWQTERGQVWEIPSKSVPGKCHRVMCGDSTVASDVSALMGSNAGISLLHADPPYGMGKESDGVANDNLYREKLDAFQMSWWRTWRPYLSDNASAYIWGNASELWRLWYVGGLANSERLTLRNEIVWDKKSNPGMSSDDMRCYSPAGNERCLFFVMGEQGFNNNADNYWEGWEPIRAYLQNQRDLAGWSNKDVAGFFGFHPRMADHWFSRSQWSLPLAEQYARLQAEADGRAFLREYDDLKREFYATRAYFDNTHDNMTDVWDFPRVVGEDRHGHATPKPVALVERAVKSSCPGGKFVAEPFLGSGSTLIAAERVGRVCVGMELSEAYVAVILERARKQGLEPRKIGP